MIRLWQIRSKCSRLGSFEFADVLRGPNRTRADYFIGKPLARPNFSWRLLWVRGKDMAKQSRDKQLLEARIRELEDELALLKAKVATADAELKLTHSIPADDVSRSQAKLSTSPLSTSYPSTTAFSEVDNWLIDTLRLLLTEHNIAGMGHALGRLGDFLGLVDCSLWRLDERHRQAESLARWQEKELPDLNQDRWVGLVLSDKVHCLAVLQSGRPLFVGPEPATGALARMFNDSGVGSSVLVPVQRNHDTAGFIALHRKTPGSWDCRELELAEVIADMLLAVDERQRLVRQLSTRDLRFQYAMDASRDGIWDWDIASGKVYYSRSYMRMLGYEDLPLPAHQKTFENLFVLPDDANKVREQFWSALDSGREYLNLEFRMRHKSGRVRWIYCRAKFVEPDSQGLPQRCVGINADITDFIQTQEQLQAAKNQADLANRAKNDFLARMSHEIRTPMNAIVGLGHLLADSPLDQRQQGYLQSINHASDSLLQMINQLLDLSKVERGNIILEQAHFDLEQALEKLSRLFEVSSIPRAIDIVYDLHKEVPRFLRGDAARLNQILRSLIDQLLRHTSGARILVQVTLGASDSKSVRLEFAVGELGAKVGAVELEQLQTSLRRDLATAATDAGSSFGLGISQHLIELMQGELRIECRPGPGCTLRFSAVFEHSQMGAKTLHEQPDRFQKLRALVVDDNALAREIMAGTLAGLGLETGSAPNADQALGSLQRAEQAQKPYDLVLMDYNMPVTDGLEAAARIKVDAGLRKPPRIFLVSSFHREEIFANNQQAELVDAFLGKPISQSRLFDALAQVFAPRELAHLEEPEQIEANRLAGVRVLLVEDNKVNQQVASGLLRKKGLEVTLAHNGRDALDRLHADPQAFDVILMDMEMPVMDGYQTSQKIRSGAVRADIPIIALTAQALRGDRARCLKAGMNAYLSKPIRPAKLYQTLQECLDQPLTNNN